MCGATEGGLSLDGVNVAKEALIQGQVLRDGEPVGNAYVRLLDRTGEFTAEVPTSASGHFRFFAGDGDWTLRTLAPKADPVDVTIAARTGVVAEAVVEAVGFSDRVHMDGPEVALGSRAALSFSLVMHELMTNACKYGALCQTGGHVEVDWAVETTQAGDELVVRWRETGGPPVIAPSRRGFGSKLVRLGLAGTGGVDLRFEPDGLQADLRASVRQLAQT